MVNDGETNEIDQMIGEHTTKIVFGNRVVVPKAFRFSDQEMIFTKGYENCLILLTTIMWKKMIAQLQNVSYFKQELRNTSRFLIGNAEKIAPDKQGRIVFKENFLDYLSLDHYLPDQEQKVVFVGVLNWIEIWKYELWQKHNKYLAENGSSIAQELHGLTLNPLNKI